ncbi:hypothetical protein CSKR_102497 [Clonorchis sinensis]|uniref:Uncharacterized protein n=1 Tax=Clonorchis sinensis TaxID=79923 RepID=A0A419QF97_CLOSI|nr:hypothetical protein CSKR_102497 [Clonorchis sinensis]
MISVASALRDNLINSKDLEPLSKDIAIGSVPWPPHVETAATNVTELPNRGFYASLRSHVLSVSGSSRSDTRLGEDGPGTEPIIWHIKYMGTAAQAMECSQLIYRGE